MRSKRLSLMFFDFLLWKCFQIRDLLASIGRSKVMLSARRARLTLSIQLLNYSPLTVAVFFSLQPVVGCRQRNMCFDKIWRFTDYFFKHSLRLGSLAKRDVKAADEVTHIQLARTHHQRTL